MAKALIVVLLCFAITLTYGILKYYWALFKVVDIDWVFTDLLKKEGASSPTVIFFVCAFPDLEKAVKFAEGYADESPTKDDDDSVITCNIKRRIPIGYWSMKYHRFPIWLRLLRYGGRFYGINCPRLLYGIDSD